MASLQGQLRVHLELLCKCFMNLLAQLSAFISTKEEVTLPRVFHPSSPSITHATTHVERVLLQEGDMVPNLKYWKS